MTVGGGDFQMQPETREGRLWKAAYEAAEQRAELAIRRMAEMAEPGWIGAFAARDAAVAERDQWRTRESETQDVLQMLGERYGVHGGEPRVAGISRALGEMWERITELESALKPFSDMAEHVETTSKRDGERVHEQRRPNGSYALLTRADFRLAQDALANHSELGLVRGLRDKDLIETDRLRYSFASTQAELGRQRTQAVEQKRRADRAEALLERLHSYAASVWFDEAVATDEERELMREAKKIGQYEARAGTAPQGETGGRNNA